MPDSKNIFEIILAILLMIIMRLLLKGTPVPALPGVVPPYPGEQNPTIA